MKFTVYLLATAFSSTTLLAQDVTPAPVQNTTITLFDLAKSGGWAMGVLGVMSVITLMLVFVYLVSLRRGAIASANFMSTVDVLLKKRDYHGLLAISNRHGEMAARVVQRTLDFATRNPKASFATIREIAQTEGSTLAASLQYRITYLADLGMLAPMVGLLGTVIGIIESFHEIAGKTDANKLLFASGISKALVCTASGLILGIFAMGCYSLFRSKVQSLISDLEIATTHIMALLALDYNKKQDTSSKAFASEEDF